MQNLRDNLTALANGDSGAPAIQTAALDSNIVTTEKLEYNAGDTRQIGTGTTVSYYQVLGSDGNWGRTCPNFDDFGGP
jgi:hypothetical protein